MHTTIDWSPMSRDGVEEIADLCNHVYTIWARIDGSFGERPMNAITVQNSVGD